MRERGGAGTRGSVKRGDIYFVVGGAAIGSEQSANRPAVVVSNDIGNRFAPIVEVVYLTTRKKVGLPTHVFIGSAPKPSVALCEQIVTVSKSRLQRRIGRVTQQEINNIDKALGKSLGIHIQEGDTVKLTMRTPFGEMNFDMPPERVSDLMQRAIQYAAGEEPQEPAAAPPSVAQEPTKAPEPKPKPQSRVERMFGNFRAVDVKDTQETVPDDGKINVTPDLPEGPQLYKGFLLVKCEKCGKLRGFCAKAPTSYSKCECGHRTELRDLKPAYLKCKCGSVFKYKTNVSEEIFDFPCLKCGNPVDLQLNKRGNAYVTIGE